MSTLSQPINKIVYIIYRSQNFLKAETELALSYKNTAIRSNRLVIKIIKVTRKLRGRVVHRVLRRGVRSYRAIVRKMRGYKISF
jgi:hypothetical protein